AARFTCTAQTRYRQPDEACEVHVLDDGTVSVQFPHPQRAVTPGQSSVLYAGDECSGGAALHQVRRIAETGQSEGAAVQASSDSVFRIDAATPLAVYGRVGDVAPGSRVLRGYLAK
ncbi:hypothetical protein OY671_012419, partial [Metschnikowia pulcherrima]